MRNFVLMWEIELHRLFWKKIKTPSVKETNKLGDTDRGNKGYGSSGINAKR